MRGWIDWARKYPMTMLLIICCLIGGPYFGGQRAIEAYKNYTGKATAADVLGTWTQKEAEHPTLLKADAQGTKEQQAAKKGGPFTDVDQSYLDDAVFIGDSRTDTLKMYAGWENTTYYVKTGTNIWDIMDVVPDDEDRTIDEELQNKQFGKVYIMLGVNELGTGTADLLPAVQKGCGAYQGTSAECVDLRGVYYSCIRREGCRGYSDQQYRNQRPQ